METSDESLRARGCGSDKAESSWWVYMCLDGNCRVDLGKPKNCNRTLRPKKVLSGIATLPELTMQNHISAVTTARRTLHGTDSQ